MRMHVNSGVDGEIIAVEPLKRSEIPVLECAQASDLDVSIVTYWSQGLKVKAYIVVPKEAGSEDAGGNSGGEEAVSGDAGDVGCVNRAEDGVSRNGLVDGGVGRVELADGGVGRDARLDRVSSWPGLLYCRGGIRRVGMVQLPRMMTLAMRGYAVMAPVYRGNLGGDGYEDFGGEDRHDVFSAIQAMRSLAWVKPEPISLLGFSRGAIMALLAAVYHGKEIGAVAVWGGVSDLLLTYEERVDLRRMLRRVVGHPKKQEEEYRRRSPINMADQIDNPVLIVHGSDDQQVSVKHAHLLAAELERAGKVYAMRLYDSVGHEFPEDIDKDALDSIFAWFAKYRAVQVDVKAGRTDE